MPIQANSKYQGVIHKARLETMEKADGGVTSSIKIRVQVAGEGFIDTNLFMTPAALPQTKKVLGELNSEIWEGTYPFLLRDPAKFLVGQPCKIETELHEFTDKNGITEKSVRVKWLNGVKAGKPATEDDISRLLQMMGVDDTYVAPEQAVEQDVF